MSQLFLLHEYLLLCAYFALKYTAFLFQEPSPAGGTSLCAGVTHSKTQSPYPREDTRILRECVPLYPE